MAQPDTTTLPPPILPPGPNMVLAPFTLSMFLLTEMAALHPPFPPPVYRQQRRYLESRCTNAYRTDLHLLPCHLTY